MLFTGAMNKIRIWPTVLATYAVVFGNLDLFVRAAWAWILVGLSVIAALALAFEGGDWEFVQDASDIALLPAWASFAVVWHRYILVGEETSSAFHLRFKKRELKFLGALILLSLVIIAPVVGFVFIWAEISVWLIEINSFVYIAVTTFIAAVAWVVFLRLSLAFPAMAIDRPSFLFGASWRATRGNTMPMVLAMILIQLPFFLITQIVEWWYEILGQTTVNSFLIDAVDILALVIGFVEFALGAAFLSLCYTNLH